MFQSQVEQEGSLSSRPMPGYGGVYEYTPVNNYVNAEIPPHLEFPMLTQAQAAAGASHELDLLRNNPHGSNQTTNMMWGQLNGNSKKATLDKREKNRENDRVRRRRIKEGTDSLRMILGITPKCKQDRARVVQTAVKQIKELREEISKLTIENNQLKARLGEYYNNTDSLGIGKAGTGEGDIRMKSSFTQSSTGLLDHNDEKILIKQDPGDSYFNVDSFNLLSHNTLHHENTKSSITTSMDPTDVSLSISGDFVQNGIGGGPFYNHSYESMFSNINVTEHGSSNALMDTGPIPSQPVGRIHKALDPVLPLHSFWRSRNDELSLCELEKPSPEQLDNSN